MPVDTACSNCIRKTYGRLADKFLISANQKTDFFNYSESLLLNGGDISMPEVQRLVQKRLQEITGVRDLFADEKRRNNMAALQLYQHWKPRVFKSENPFDMGLRLALAGNIMDFAANHEFDVQKTIQDVLAADFALDHSFLLKQSIASAKNILYLGDNAGEIALDKLFIETFPQRDIIFAVKGGAILNDATMSDALMTGMNDVARVVSNDYDAPSTILEKSGGEFCGYYNTADIIISKGQGNFEGLMACNDSRIFFLLTVKCGLIAQGLGVPVGSFVVFNPSVNHP